MENDELKVNKKRLGLSLIIIGIILIALGCTIIFIPKLKDKVSGNKLSGEKKEIYNTYIDYLSEYKNNEISDNDGEKQKTKYVYLRMIKAEGVDKPIMMVDALNEKYGIITDMYYIDKDGKVKQEKFIRDTVYGALYDFETKTYDYYLLQYTKNGLESYDHIINLSDYINKVENIREYDTLEYDPRFIGFELDGKVTIDGNPEKALTKAIKNMKSLKEFYKDEKEIIDDAHQEYKAMHEDDEEEIKEETKEEEKPKTKCNSGFVYVSDDNRCYSNSQTKPMDTSCKNGYVNSPGGCAQKVDASLCESGNDQYENYNGNCIDKYTDSSTPMDCPNGYEILFGSYGGKDFNGACYKWEKPNY